MVCVQPLLVCRAREIEGLTWDKFDPKDGMGDRAAGEVRGAATNPNASMPHGRGSAPGARRGGVDHRLMDSFGLVIALGL